MPNWTDKCHVCGVNIWNGVPKEHQDRISEYVAEMEKEGWVLGYKDKTVGTFGNLHEVSIKPICQKCNAKANKIISDREIKKAMSKVKKLLKKQFSCPVCEHSQARGYNTKVFKSSSKQDIITHITEKHNNLTDLKSIIPYED